MHPVTANRLAYSLATRSESSFPERHVWPESDDISHVSGDDSTAAGAVVYAQSTASKSDMPVPGLSSFWHQTWHEQTHSLLHGDDASNSPLPGSLPPITSHRIEHPIDRRGITTTHSSVGGHHAHVFTSSPVQQQQQLLHVATDPAQTEWDIMRTGIDQAMAEFPWLPTVSPTTTTDDTGSTLEPNIKIEDDSDSNWSLNDSSEDLQLPPPRQMRVPPVQRFKRHTVPRVTKASRLERASSGAGGGSYHTFRATPKQSVRAAGLAEYSVEKTAVFRQTGYDAMLAAQDGAAAARMVDLTGMFADDFSAKLMEKRIAHKLSEKSRRNRLTAAIREIEKLMPAEREAAGEGGGGDEEDEGMRQGNLQVSKVDVVERAVGYIRRLQREKERLAKRAEQAEKKLRLREGDGEKEP